ncbi:nuclear transport factor 2 family protein [Amycolatopsis pithecellobii]|uniref:Nuclear transport factor 2 family protein n=1 Tax=Amycolatopsis pithecellobii TaxID=664692 RepID=A0A6N7Z782_9PSEU|nr:nuclear transport factor 2 family protein [Amycolatopsis pithecellobii]MTD57999.1 nuclear transport factor 2 family protein [Amycolatopsis pithecellobii]
MTELTAEHRSLIEDVVALHGHIFDAKEFDRIEEIFTPDVVYDMTGVGGRVFRGIAAVREAASDMAARGPLAHHVTNLVVTVTDDGVPRVLSKVLLLLRDGSLKSVVQRDTIGRHDGHWLISHRVIEPVAGAARTSGSHP